MWGWHSKVETFWQSWLPAHCSLGTGPFETSLSLEGMRGLCTNYIPRLSVLRDIGRTYWASLRSSRTPPWLALMPGKVTETLTLSKDGSCVCCRLSHDATHWHLLMVVLGSCSGSDRCHKMGKRELYTRSSGSRFQALYHKGPFSSSAAMVPSGALGDMWSISVPASGNLSPTFTALMHCGSLSPSCRWCPIGTTEKPVQLPTSRSLFTLAKTFFFQNKVIYTGCRFGPHICGWPSSCVSWWKPQIWALNADPWLTGDIPLAALWLRKASWPARWRASCLTWHQKPLAQKMILTLTEDFPLWPNFIWSICPNVSDFIITALLIHS